MNIERHQERQNTGAPPRGFQGNGFYESHPQGQSDMRVPFSNIVLYRSILNDLPLLIISLLAVSIAFGIALFLRASAAHFLGYEQIFIFGLSLISVCIILFAVIFFRRFNVRYLIADDGIKAVRGILSNHQVDAKLEYYQIRGTEIHRSFFERLIGTGDLHVHGSTSNDTEVSFKGIFEPYRYQKVIQERHRLNVQGREAQSTDDGRQNEGANI